jgi:hypothetical protein
MRFAFGLATGLVCLTWGASALAQMPPPAAPPPAAGPGMGPGPAAGPAVAASPYFQNLGSPGQFALSAERMMGVSAETMKLEVSEYGYSSDVTLKQTHVAFLGIAPSAAFDESLPPSFALSPRLGFDFFPTKGLSLGLAAGVGFASGEIEASYGGYSATEDTPKVTSVAVNPRIGYAAAFNDIVAIWPRAGVTFMNSVTKSEDSYYPYGTVEYKTTVNATAVTIEALLALSPVNHFAILIGPFADIGVAGKYKYEESGGGYTAESEADLTITSFGLTVGITGFMP